MVAQFLQFAESGNAATVSDVATNAIESIERARADDDGTLARALAGSDLPTARRAALALGRTKRASAAPPLRRQFRARDVTLRALATYGIGLIARPEDLDAVRVQLRDASSAVRYAAVDAVGRTLATHHVLVTDALARDLLDLARGDPDEAVRGHAAACLDVFGTLPSAPRTARSIEAEYARERSARVRWHLMWVLYRAYARVADPHVLASALESRDELVRVEALRAVGRRSDAGAEHFVRPLVADTSWRVQLQARETLLALAGQLATAHLTTFPPALNLPVIPAVADTPTPIPLPPVPTPLAAHAGAATASPGPGPSLAPPPTSSLAYGPALFAETAEAFDGPAPGPHPRVRLQTSRGAIVLRLYPEWAPVTVANFLSLTARGYFDGNRWFRIVPDFVHQTGDATNDADHDSGYTIGGEENPIEQDAGVVAMGLDYENGHAVRDSAGTQFYVTDSPQLHLDRDFTVFGRVETGFDVLANLLESDRIVHAARISDD